ncbi:MAG: factor-independent urate hydroxylase [Ktedonobacteraceae bacterium]
MNVENNYNYVISYGKAQVPIYRMYAPSLTDVSPIPESAFTGRGNVLFAVEVDVEVFGENFLPAYTQGDNTMVVATDTMKNFILQQALVFNGSTLEDFLVVLGHQFLATYPQMERLRLTGRELAFTPSRIPLADSAGFGDSKVLFKRSNDDFRVASIDFTSNSKNTIITAHRCGRVGLQLLKVTGSAFTQFIRDTYTTLPDRGDRPLFIYLDVYWKYSNPEQIQSHYIPSEQVRDVVQVVFHEFVSESIQHLVHEMGLRLLERFPQMAEVSFDGQNRTRDPISVSETDSEQKVYSDPFPAYGMIKLTMSRKT